MNTLGCINVIYATTTVIDKLRASLISHCYRSHESAARLFENTFQLDVLSARDFCEADDRWIKSVQFLDADGRAGWELLAAMLNSNWRLRPTAQSCLVHRFLSSS